MTERNEIPDQMKPIIEMLLRPKPQIFQGSYGRWYVRHGENTPENNCPSFHTETQAIAWADWKKE